MLTPRPEEQSFTSMGRAKDLAHPFDPAYGMMKELKAEVAQLKETLQAEQRTRNKEVTQLQREVQSLQQALAKEQSDRMSDTKRLTQALTTETAMRGKALEKCRSEIAEAMQRLESIGNLQQHHDGKISKMSIEMVHEIRERKLGQKDLEKKLGQEADTRSHDVQNLAQALAAQSQTSHANSMFNKEKLFNLTRTCQLAGHLLNMGSASAPTKELSETVVNTLSAATRSPLTDTGISSVPGAASTSWEASPFASTPPTAPSSAPATR